MLPTKERLGPLPHFRNSLEDLILYHDIEGGGGLIGDHEGWLESQGHGDVHSLPHSAAELVRVLLRTFGGDTDPLQKLPYSRS